MTYQWTKQSMDYRQYTCPIHKTTLLVGDRWTLFLIREFIYESKEQGFNQLLRALKPISSRTLSKKLKQLVEHGILQKKVGKENSMQVKYHITKKGKALKKALDSMGVWYKQYNQ